MRGTSNRAQLALDMKGRVADARVVGASTLRLQPYRHLVGAGDARRGRDHHAARFRELADIVGNALDYARVVQRLGNLDDERVIDSLGDVLEPHIVVTLLRVTASTSQGARLSSAALAKVSAVAAAMLRLGQARQRIFEHVASRMQSIAPNLSAIVGTSIAAQLIGVSGGLEALAGMPSCNVQVLGKKYHALAGFSGRANNRHHGVIADCEVIRTTPNHLKNKALRIVSSKSTLAARLDSAGSDPSGESGRRWRLAIDKKIAKWQEPPPIKLKKALPIPKGKTRKKRGGRKYKRQRELRRMSELQKQKNRVIFGKTELTDDYSGESFGMLGQEAANAGEKGERVGRGRVVGWSHEEEQEAGTEGHRHKADTGSSDRGHYRQATHSASQGRGCWCQVGCNGWNGVDDCIHTGAGH